MPGTDTITELGNPIYTTSGGSPCNGGGFGHQPSEPAQSAFFFFGSALFLAFPVAIFP